MTELSNLSYTNKDFNSIYTELLEYAKKLSYKWDPTISNESDPGVVLLKLAAIIGDKDNYNIDKNVLELMPSSVTQMYAARQIFNQCGYNMRHYMSATGKVNLTLTNLKVSEGSDFETGSVTLPNFTMITDTDNSVVYTMTPTQEHSIDWTRTHSFDFIEGIATVYSINNETLITPMNLDSNNRLYFPTLTIPENGIFITNVGPSTNYEKWHKVDNLEIQPLGEHCYKFGLSDDNTSCYVEFPSDVYALFEEGINITYVTTSGVNGNVPAHRLNRFYVNPTVTQYIDGVSSTEEEMTTQNISIHNVLPINNGQDPETIDQAYKSYQRVKDTFKTLVSLKDYRDYLLSNNQASNVFISDRTNDIQQTYKVVTVPYTGSDSKHVVESGGPSAFNLRVHALAYVPTIDKQSDYEETFLVSNLTYDSTFTEVKSIQHDFLDYAVNTPIFIKNTFEFDINVIPKYKLSVNEQHEIRETIEKSVWKATNSKEQILGTEIPYETLYNAVYTADNRIKAVSVSYPEYTSYATVYDGENFIDVSLTGDVSGDLTALQNAIKQEIYVKNILAGVTPLVVPDSDNSFSVGLIQQCKDVVTSSDNKVSTETKLSSTDGTFPTLLEHESILLTSDSYIKDTPYSSYVKVLYSLDNPVNTNKIYELTNSEFIVFFWKNADTDSYYTYRKYTPTSVAKYITSTSTLDSDKNFEDIDDDVRILQLLTTLNEGSGTLDARFEDLNTCVKSLTSTTQVLQGTHVITTMRPNSVVVNDTFTGTNNAYWILNSSDQILFSTGASEYTLTDGEYFFYTNKEKTLLSVNGSGTIIKLDTSAQTPYTIPSHNRLTYEDFLKLELSEIQWFDIGFTNKLNIIEQEQLLLGPGCTLSHLGTDVVTIGNQPTSITVQLSYTDAQNNSHNVPVKPNGWKVSSRLALAIDPDTAQEIVYNKNSREQSVSLNTGSDTIPTGLTSSTVNTSEFLKCNIPINITGGSDVDLTTYAELYSTEHIKFLPYSLSDTTSLDPSISIDNNLNTCSINHNSNIFEPDFFIFSTQAPTNGVKIYIKSDDGTQELTTAQACTADFGESHSTYDSTNGWLPVLNDDKYYYCGINFGRFTNITEIRLDTGETSIGSYGLCQMHTLAVVTEVDNTSYTISVDDLDLINDALYFLPTVKIPAGKYIVQLSISDKINSELVNLLNIYMESGSSPLSKIFENSSLFYNLSVDSDTNDFQLFLHVPKTFPSCVFTFNKLYKYTSLNGGSTFSETYPLTAFEKYDTSDFNMFYVNDQTQIINPLTPRSFFDKNHVYNPITVSKWNTPTANDTSRLRILNAIL